MLKLPRVILLLSLLVTAAWSQTRQAASGHVDAAPARDRYVGDAACKGCHEAEFTSYETTAHHLTSRVPDEHSIAGNFHDGANLLKTSNPALYFKMTTDHDGWFETAVDAISPEKNIELRERLDVVVGSGRKAQTYLYWKGDLLFELPVSYWMGTGEWINSPGYEDGGMRFDRGIYPRCLECHGNQFVSQAPPANRYERASVELGIGCERCHGPGAKHVVLYRSAQPPKAGEAKGIVNPATLSRARQMDTCAICHAGLGKALMPALSYVPGAALEKYMQITDMDPDHAVDVHGNQVQLLKSSKCFRASQMTCDTCHNVHTPQRDAASYSKYCLNCHKAEQCGKFKTMGEQITRNCVDCHMPLKQSQSLFFNTSTRTLQLPVRDHRIAVYADAALPEVHP